MTGEKNKPKTIASVVKTQATKDLEKQLNDELVENSEELSISELRSLGLLKGKHGKSKQEKNE